jgi:hypothetical protein
VVRKVMEDGDGEDGDECSGEDNDGYGESKGDG